MNISEHVTISIELTLDEHEKFERLAHKQGFTALTDYVQHLMLQDLDVEDEELSDSNLEESFREGWADIVAGRVHPASALWDETDEA